MAWGEVFMGLLPPRWPVLAGLLAVLWATVYLWMPDHRAVSRMTAAWLVACVLALAIGTTLHWGDIEQVGEVVHKVGIIGLGLVFIRLSGLLLVRRLLPLVRFSPPRIFEDLLVMAGYALWGLIHLRYSGIDLASLVTTSAIITAVVAFAMQDTLGNVLSGLAIQWDNSVRVGEWVKVGEIFGQVVDVRWRATTVETMNWETVVIPNSVLMKSAFSIIGKRQNEPEQWRRQVPFVVSMEQMPHRVMAVAEKALREAAIDGVARLPEPNVVLQSFEQGNARYVARYWLTRLGHEDVVDSAVRVHLVAGLARAGYKIGIPAYELLMIKENEAQAAAQRQREVERRLVAMRQVDLFRHMDVAELRRLAERLQFAPFAKGDVITRQGDVAHWLYILVHGTAAVSRVEDGRERYLGLLEAGSLFGEMGLMTGAPRSATVVATSDVECYKLDKNGFQEVLLGRTEIADEISHILASRQAENQQQGAIQTLAPAPAHELLGKIRAFFKLD